MHAIKYLLQEHTKFRRNFAKIKKSKSSLKIKKRMFNTLTTDLKQHEKMEETIWYPFLKKQMKITSTIKHLVSEEKKAARTIPKVKKLADEEEWFEHFLDLKTDVEHHANEEETKLFPKVQEAIDEKDLKTIGKKMKTYKQRLTTKRKR